VIERHAAVMFEERGWGREFEAAMVDSVHEFLTGHDPERARAWIAELDGVRAGMVYCARRSEEVAQLRLLLVEPWARGHGIGALLVGTCVDFARRSGYRRIVLWTNSTLDSARAIYEAAGFRLVEEAPSDAFDPASVGQSYELQL
jgi:GNAT superfamily N-acetyltransferase